MAGDLFHGAGGKIGSLGSGGFDSQTRGESVCMICRISRVGTASSSAISAIPRGVPPVETAGR